MFEGDHKFDYFIHAHSLVTHGGFRMSWLVFFSDAIQALGNAKGTLCKGEITTAKSLLSFSLSLSSLTLSLSLLQSGGKIALAEGGKPWKREADAL